MNEFTVSVYVRRFSQRAEILLVKHKRYGIYVPVGGRIDPGERPLQAAKRELKEETGLEGSFPLARPELDLNKPDGLIGYEEHEAGPNWHMNFAFVADVDSSALTPCDEWEDPIWVTEAPETSPPNVKELVQRALRAPRPRSCGDCGAKSGEEHGDGCDIERCTLCKGQRMLCSCAGHDKHQARWTGYWPGELEARARGWFAVCVGVENGPIYSEASIDSYIRLCRSRDITPIVPSHQSWMPCAEDYPGAVPDINRVEHFQKYGQDDCYPTARE